MVIDGHNHPDWHGHDLHRFLQNMDDCGIDKTCLLSWECPVDEYDPQYNGCVGPGGPDGPIPFSRCLAYKEQAPDRFILGYAPDPRRPDAIDRLRAGIEIFSVQVYGELKLRMMFDDLDAIAMYRYCGEQGLPVLVHIDYPLSTGVQYPRPNYWYGGGIEPFERAIAACPGSIFLGHGPGFWAHISNDRRWETQGYPAGPVVPGGKISSMLRTYPNLYCDLAAGSALNALTRDPDFGREFALEFQDRLVYGRDYFENQHQETLNAMGLPAEALAKILGGNAQRLLG